MHRLGYARSLAPEKDYILAAKAKRWSATDPDVVIRTSRDRGS